MPNVKKYLFISLSKGLIIGIFIVIGMTLTGLTIYLVQAGSLTPPGPPAPTMHTLDEIYNAVVAGGGSPAGWNCQTVTESDTTWATAACPTGTTLIWGYCRSTIAYLDFPYWPPGGNRWSCRNGDPGEGGPITAYAICCQ